MQIIIIGRGHSGTRAIGATLATSGIYMGNVSPRFDLLPPQAMYAAVRMAGQYVRQIGEAQWDFSALLNTPAPENFRQLVKEYLAGFAGHETYAWKLPETALALPWIVEMYPEAYYIHWVRDGRDSILKEHGTDHLRYWKIPSKLSNKHPRLIRAATSWKYHEDLIAATPKPQHWVKIRLRDFVQRQSETLGWLSYYLGRPLNTIPVFQDVIGRYQSVDLNGAVDIMRPQLIKHGFMT